jgi:hypothetical protein
MIVGGRKWIATDLESRIVRVINDGNTEYWIIELFTRKDLATRENSNSELLCFYVSVTL